MSYEDEEIDRYGDLHSDCVSVDDALEFAVEHYWDDIRAMARVAESGEWLRRSKPFVELLSKVSRHDKDQLRDFIKLGITENRENASGEISESQMFSVATEVGNFLEALTGMQPIIRPEPKSPFGQYRLQNRPEATSYLLSCLDSCPIGDDLSWARDLILVTRTFRDILFAISEPLEPLSNGGTLNEALNVLNDMVQRSSNNEIAYWQTPEKTIAFGRIPHGKSTPLVSCLTNWFVDYLVNFYPVVNLAVCVECGIFFPRQRKDNVYCGKTCQNRVAYKRKKIFETNALSEVSVDPETTAEIRPGLMFYHHRLGLGVIEEINYLVNKVVDRFDSNASDSFKAKFFALRAKSIRVKVRFLHGVRTLRHAELFAVPKGENLPRFYSMSEPEVVAALF
jgi:hypothetical protein